MIYYILVFISAMMSLGMIVCVFSTHFSPAKYPIISSWGLVFPFFLAINIVSLIFWLVVKWRIAWIPLLALVCCWGSIRAYIPFNIPKKAPEKSIKLLSFNTQTFGKWFGRRNMKKFNENAVNQYIRNSGADIVCLQEILWIDDINQYKMDDIYPYGYLTVVPARSRLAIFSKYPIIDAEIITYPTVTNCSAIYHLLIEGDTITVINNHLESYKLKNDDKENYNEMINEKDVNKENSKKLLNKISFADSLRALQTDVLYDLVEKELRCRDGVIVCGDFNDSPVSYVHYRLTRLLNDAYTQSGNGIGFSYYHNKMYFRIDHILVSDNYEAYEAKVDKSFKASDHYPIYTYIKKKKVAKRQKLLIHTCQNIHFLIVLTNNNQFKCKYLLLNSIKPKKSTNFANLNYCVRTKRNEKRP
ncbi:MAG: endonuclease/exonuclease/phosphatase family protein [Bacteroidaceae bacterium]|nr:endonuclease/exonuclease/phosphatase family protein [Bacteroidaceae bacterium]